MCARKEEREKVKLNWVVKNYKCSKMKEEQRGRNHKDSGRFFTGRVTADRLREMSAIWIVKREG